SPRALLPPCRRAPPSPPEPSRRHGDRRWPRASPSRKRSGTSAASPRDWSRRRRRPRREPRTSARYAQRGRGAQSPLPLPSLQVLADDVEETLPAQPLPFYPIRGVAERLRPEREPVGPAVDHAAHDARLLQQLQVPRDGRLGDAEVPGHLSDCRRPDAEPFYDLAPEWMRERLERIVRHYANYRGSRPTPDRRHEMTEHRLGTQQEWQAERDELLKEEKDLTRRSDELAGKRRPLPWI